MSEKRVRPVVEHLKPTETEIAGRVNRCVTKMYEQLLEQHLTDTIKFGENYRTFAVFKNSLAELIGNDDFVNSWATVVWRGGKAYRDTHSVEESVNRLLHARDEH